MPERATAYTNVSVGGPHGVDIIHVQSTRDPLLDFEISRDWASDVIEVGGSTSIRFDRRDGTAIAVHDGSSWRPPTPDDQPAVAAARGRCGLVGILLTPLRRRSNGNAKSMVAVLAWFDKIVD